MGQRLPCQLHQNLSAACFHFPNEGFLHNHEDFTFQYYLKCFISCSVLLYYDEISKRNLNFVSENVARKLNSCFDISSNAIAACNIHLINLFVAQICWLGNLDLKIPLCLLIGEYFFLISFSDSNMLDHARKQWCSFVRLFQHCCAGNSSENSS